MKKIFIALAILASSISFAANAQTKKATVITLNTKEFCEKVYDINAETLKYLGDKPAIIDFYADWCGPCQALTPTLQKIAEKYKGQVVVYKVNVDNAQEVAQAFGISSIPAILYIPLEGKPHMTLGFRGFTRFDYEVGHYLL
jgi:thioredoxin